jgi:pyrroloquinoline quinone biosynthesis protein E
MLLARRRAMPTPEASAPLPYTLIAELTYRCPLRCAYCSNPVHYAGLERELDTAQWLRVLSEAEQLGVMQLNLTGGEPLLRPDLEQLVGRARELGLYTSLITSAVGLGRSRLQALRDAGLDHVQVSIQGVTEADAERIAGRGELAQKLQSMAWVRELELPLTLNVVLHRENIDQVPELIALAERVGAQRIELANTQYLGWALENRDALLPNREQIARARVHANAARERLRGAIEVLFVLPDYQAELARPCMQGWARRYVLVTPDGWVLPCHQAHTLPGLVWERVGARTLAEIWRDSPGLNAYRGNAWMEEPCRSCERRELDFGGCRCQAFHLTGQATRTDPTCVLAPDHALVSAAIEAAQSPRLVPLRYRRVPRRA